LRSLFVLGMVVSSWARAEAGTVPIAGTSVTRERMIPATTGYRYGLPEALRGGPVKQGRVLGLLTGSGL